MLLIATGTCVDALTKFSEILTANGIDCKVDSVFTSQGKKLDSGIVEAEASIYAMPYLSNREFASAKVIHVIDNPLRTIEFALSQNWFSGTTPKNQFEQFFHKHIAELSGPYMQISKICCWWLTWNKKIKQETHPSKYFRFIPVVDKMPFVENAEFPERPDVKFSVDKITNAVLKAEIIKEAKKLGFVL